MLKCMCVRSLTAIIYAPTLCCAYLQAGMCCAMATHFVSNSLQLFSAGQRGHYALVLHQRCGEPPQHAAPLDRTSAQLSEFHSMPHLGRERGSYLSLYIGVFNHKHLWRNWLARSAVNRKVGGSSPPRCVFVLLFSLQIIQYHANLIQYIVQYILTRA